MLGNKVVLLGAVGQKSELNKNCRHRRTARHIKRLLLHPAVLATHIVPKGILNLLGQFHTLLDEGILKHGKHDVGLRLSRVKALINILVVFLKNHGIFAHGNAVLVVVVLTHYIGRRAIGGAVLCRVAVNRNKDIALRPIGYDRALVQRWVGIVSAGHHHLNVGMALQNILFNQQGNCERDVFLCFFIAAGAQIPWVFAAVAGIDNYGANFIAHASRRLKSRMRNCQ